MKGLGVSSLLAKMLKTLGRQNPKVKKIFDKNTVDIKCFKFIELQSLRSVDRSIKSLQTNKRMIFRQSNLVAVAVVEL